MKTTIYEHLELSVDEVLDWLQINVIELDGNNDIVDLPAESEIQRLIDAAKQKADNFVDREEEYFEINDEVVIPEQIKQWVLSVVARWYEQRASGEGTRNIQNAEAVDWDDIDFSDLIPYQKKSRPYPEDDETEKWWEHAI